MDKVGILKSLSALSFLGILFTPIGSKYLGILLFFGFVFGIFWFIKS